MIYTDLLKTIWRSIYDPKTKVTEVVEKYFHENYAQCINGVNLNRTEYIQHVLGQKQNMLIDTIEYKHVLEKENELFALYYASGKNTNNLPIEAEVIAYFRFENAQLLNIHGQVRLIRGDFADVDMKGLGSQ